MNRGHIHREQLGPAARGRALLDFLVADWRHGERAEWEARLARGELSLDGALARGDEALRAGALLEWRRPPWEEPRVPLGFALLHRDDDVLAVAKPAGLPTMPSGGRFLEHTLLTQVRRRFPEATLVHRLDRGTSGIVVMARTPAARRGLGERFAGGAIERLYRGLVVGDLGDGERRLDTPIGELPDARIGRVFAAVERGAATAAAARARAALTRVRPLERRGATTLVEIAIGSGRPHQIRIHLAHAGHPLVGEPFFGEGGRPIAGTSALPGDPGYLLHALALRFVHPAGGRELSLWCAPPPALRCAGDAMDVARAAPSQRDATSDGTPAGA